MQINIPKKFFHHQLQFESAYSLQLPPTQTPPHQRNLPPYVKHYNCKLALAAISETLFIHKFSQNLRLFTQALSLSLRSELLLRGVPTSSMENFFFFGNFLRSCLPRGTHTHTQNWMLEMRHTRMF